MPATHSLPADHIKSPQFFEQSSAAGVCLAVKSVNPDHHQFLEKQSVRLNKKARQEQEALLAQVAQIHQIAMGIETGYMAIQCTDVYTGKWDGGKAWHNLGPKLCQFAAVFMVEDLARWNQLGPNQKAHVADYIMPEWVPDADDYTHYWFYSITRDNLRHQLKYDPRTGDMECNCEAGHHGRNCFHKSLFVMRYKHIVDAQWEAANPSDSCAIARSEFTQGMDEKPLTPRERIARDSHKLINREADCAI